MSVTKGTNFQGYHLIFFEILNNLLQSEGVRKNLSIGNELVQLSLCLLLSGVLPVTSSRTDLGAPHNDQKVGLSHSLGCFPWGSESCLSGLELFSCF